MYTEQNPNPDPGATLYQQDNMGNPFGKDPNPVAAPPLPEIAGFTRPADPSNYPFNDIGGYTDPYVGLDLVFNKVTDEQLKVRLPVGWRTREALSMTNAVGLAICANIRDDKTPNTEIGWEALLKDVEGNPITVAVTVKLEFKS